MGMTLEQRTAYLLGISSQSREDCMEIEAEIDLVTKRYTLTGTDLVERSDTGKLETGDSDG